MTLRIVLSAVMAVLGGVLAYLNMWHPETPIWVSIIFLVLALALLPLVMPNP